MKMRERNGERVNDAADGDDIVGCTGRKIPRTMLLVALPGSSEVCSVFAVRSSENLIR